MPFLNLRHSLSIPMSDNEILQPGALIKELLEHIYKLHYIETLGGFKHEKETF